MHRLNSKSLMFKTMSIITFFSILILLIMYLFQILFSNFYYERSKIREVRNIADNIEDNVDKVDAYLSKATSESDVCIEYKLTNGSILYNENAKGCILAHSNKKVDSLKNEMYGNDNNMVFYTITNPLFNSKSYLYGVRLSNGAYVYINSQLESLDNTYIVLKNQLIYLLILVILLAVIISYFISTALTHPILEITGKAKKLGNGDLSVSFNEYGIQEVDELSDTLNYAKSEMIKMDDYRRDLMANVGHDLKTPLTLIRSYAEMVRDITYKDEEKRTENLNVIISETDRLNDLVNDILVLSKIESNKDSIEIEEYDLVNQIKEILSKFEILSMKEGYNFKYIGPKKALVHADKNKISQVIYNLVNNAVNYTGDDQKVTVKVSAKDGGYLVEVKDTGKGIDDETIKHIWDRYYKTEKKHKRNKVGTGLGLAIVKEILEIHGFKYGVNSKIGKGTNFYFTIKK